ncbi:hypothetical protein ACHAWF_014847 [Thalassiosira exigua]
MLAARFDGEFDDDEGRDDELRRELRKLATLNGGKTVNPRSPKQVSDLLYGPGSMGYDGNGGREPAGGRLGPTDKGTLRRILFGDGADSEWEDDEKALEKRKEVASAVLRCRELLSSTHASGGKKTASSSASSSSSSSSSSSRGSFGLGTASEFPTAGGDSDDQPLSVEVELPSLLDGRRQENVQVADSSSAAHNATIIGSADWHRWPLRGTWSEAAERNGAATTSRSFSSASSPSTEAYPSMSPFERTVMALFPDPPNADDGSATDEEEEEEDAPYVLDPYWIDPLLSLTKPAARSLVRQLRPDGCPMGYDPSASPVSNLRSRETGGSTTTPQKRTTALLGYVRSRKAERHPDAVVLVRVGDFYESYGVDALLLVEHCGLNPMAGKARAGCPWRNVQSTLDGLTSAGLRVAVYEEWNGEGADPTGGNGVGKLKTRYLSQVVSSANPTYLHGLVLNDDGGGSVEDHGGPSSASSSSPGRSYVGVLETSAGYALVEVSAEERTARVSERLTAEAASCRLAAYPPADPLFYVPASAATGAGASTRRTDRLPFLPWRQGRSPAPPSLSRLGGGAGADVGYAMGHKVRVKTLPPSLVVDPRPGLSDVERAKQTIVSAFLRLEDDSLPSRSPSSDGERRGAATHDDFALVASSGPSADAEPSSATEARPLHLETATQLGLMTDPAIPSLIASLLPDSAPASSRHFLRRWLLVPPPPDIADAMSRLVRNLKDECDRALPSLRAPPLGGRAISLIRAGQASAAVYREILSSLDAASEVLLLDEGEDSPESIVKPLMEILRHDTGIDNNSGSLRRQFLDATTMIESVVSTYNLEHSPHKSEQTGDEVDDLHQLDYISYHGDAVPPAFYERNEATWRGRVKPGALKHAHDVPLAAKRLARAIAVDFWGVDANALGDGSTVDLSTAKETKNPVLQDIFNNLLAMKSLPPWTKESESNYSENGKSPQYFHPRDRNGKVLRNRYTTELVQEAMSEYVEACANARSEVESVLTRLSWDLVDNGHLPAILQASHLNIILQTAAHHAASSNAKGWSTAAIYDEDSSAGHFEGVWPYWMDRSESVSNTFDLDGLFLLTAPNMSGKSTLMRSTAAAAHLINCGFCAPVDPGTWVRRFDSIFVRGASADVPTENKSAFGAEMGDVAALIRSCGRRSLVFVDEIGRGTSPKDGTSLAGAILEGMSESYMSGMFATHLHGILELPYSPEAEARLRKKRMAISEDFLGQPSWTYKMEDGVCTNSLALLTAAKFGLPGSILRRAEELSQYWSEEDLGGTAAKTSNDFGGLNGIQSAKSILEEAAGKSSSIQIPQGYMSPPSLEGVSCVYLLQIGNEEDKMRYYVGETDSLAQRLLQHRSKGEDWSYFSAVAIKMDDKSAARNVESLVIQRMARSGFNLVSVADGMSIRRPRRTQ